MRIVQLIDSFTSTGGVERFIYNLSKQIVQANHETFIVTLEPATNGKHWGEDTFENICLGPHDGDWAETIMKLRPHLVIWHGSAGMSELASGLSQQYPVIATIHGAFCPSGSRLFKDTNEICLKKGGYSCFLSWYKRNCGYGRSPVKVVSAVRTHFQVLRALMKCERIYTVSNSVSEILEREGLPTSKLQVFDNTLGLLPQLSEHPIQPLSLNKPLHLFYAGRLVYNKGIQYLIRAVYQLDKQGVAVICHIAGEGWYEHELRTMVKELCLHTKVKFHGHMTGAEIREMYAESDIVVVPSIWPEPAGLVVPEAREQGKPVVVFDAGGLPEWADYLNGIYVARRLSVDSLGETILEARTAHAIQSCRPESQGHAPIRTGRTDRVDLLRDCETWIG